MSDDDDDDVNEVPPQLENDDEYAVASSHLNDQAAAALNDIDISASLIGQRRHPIVHSIHSSATLNRAVDLRDIARRCDNAVYMPSKVNGVILTLRQPRTSVTVFASGKVICLGATSSVAAIRAVRKTARHIAERLGADYAHLSINAFRVNNVTASAHFGYAVDLPALARSTAHKDAVEYDPAAFAGLFYKLSFDKLPQQTPVNAVSPTHLPKQTALTLCIHYNGAVTLTGARSELDITHGFAYMTSVLWPFADRKKFVATAPTSRFSEWIKWADAEERKSAVPIDGTADTYYVGRILRAAVAAEQTVQTEPNTESARTVRTEEKDLSSELPSSSLSLESGLSSDIADAEWE